MSAWVSTPPVMARVFTMVNAISFLWLKGWHAPAGRRIREPRPLPRPGGSDRHRRWVPQKPGTRPTDRLAGQPERRQPIRRSGRDPGTPTLRPYHTKTAEAGPEPEALPTSSLPSLYSLLCSGLRWARGAYRPITGLH